MISSRRVGETERAVAVTASTQVHLKSFTRAASGKIDDHVWIEKLDLRTHLQAPPSAPEGIDLLALCNKLLTNAIRPVLKEVNITGALGHIAGAFFSSGSSRSVWEFNSGRPTPSARCCLRSCICSMAWIFQAIDATLSPWPLDSVH